MSEPRDHEHGHGHQAEDFDRSQFGDKLGYTERGNTDGTTHHTAFDRDSQSHISWNTDKNGDYREGSGHTDNGRGRESNWGSSKGGDPYK